MGIDYRSLPVLIQILLWDIIFGHFLGPYLALIAIQSILYALYRLSF